MKHFFVITAALVVSACSAFQPYKDQSFDYLQGIAKHPSDYYGKVVCFGGEIKGMTESTHTIRLVLKTEAPFYYAATGKGGGSYELLLVDYAKTSPAMSGLVKGNEIKILARVSSYEKRKNMLGTSIGVLHLTAFALSDRKGKKDFFQTTSPEKQLYESWKKGRLFYEETPEQLMLLYPSATPEQPKNLPPTDQKMRPAAGHATPAAGHATAAWEIVYDEEEEFVLP